MAFSLRVLGCFSTTSGPPPSAQNVPACSCVACAMPMTSAASPSTERPVKPFDDRPRTWNMSSGCTIFVGEVGSMRT